MSTVVDKKEKVSVPFDYNKYLRPNKLPHIWCPGCGHGIVLKSMLRAIDKAGLDKSNIALVSGIGCSSRTPGYVDFNTLHTLHGRALAFATGIKLANPDLKIIVIMGDGDASAIGGNHFIHACRRNLEMTALIFNNGIYGLTGGQLAPTTPEGKRSTTSLSGSIEPAFDLVKLALGAGAGFVARTTSFDHKQMASFIRRAIVHPGFSVVDILTSCPTYFGRLNDVAEPYDMVRYLRDTTCPLQDCTRGQSDGDGEAPEGRMPIGVFRDQERTDYGTLYARRVADAAQARRGA